MKRKSASDRSFGYPGISAKGGRISKTVAIAGSLLSIKPVVSVVDGEVALLGKARPRQGNLPDPADSEGRH
ncbi:MAG: DegV family protein [Gallintestinimicrobium sp.]